MNPRLSILPRLRSPRGRASPARIAATASLALATISLGTPVRAGTVTVVFREVGPDVVASYSGSISAGLSANGSLTDQTVAVSQPSGGSFRSQAGVIDIWSTGDFTGPLSFGTGGSTVGDYTSGDPFGLRFENWFGPEGSVLLSPSYTWGDPISGVATFVSASFSSLGIGLGTYTWDLKVAGNTVNTVVLRTESSPVPEIDPAGMGSVLALLTGALGLFERRRLQVA